MYAVTPQEKSAAAADTGSRESGLEGGGNQVATRPDSKSVEVADSKGAFFEVHPTRVFLSKSSDFIENKGVDVLESGKEFIVD